MKSDKAHLLQQTRARQMRRASRRTEQVTAMAIVPVSPKPFFTKVSIFGTYIFHQKKEWIRIPVLKICIFTDSLVQA